MGHEYVEYKNQSVRLHDLNIWMLRHFLLEASENEQLSTFVENIEWLGPGVFTGTALHDFVKDDKAKLDVLILALEKAKNLIESFGEFIPLSYLEENVNLKSSYFTAKQPSNEYSQSIESILNAIKKVENTDYQK